MTIISTEVQEQIKQPKAVYFMPNGQIMSFDEKGHQIPELQKSVFQHYIGQLLENGLNPEEILFSIDGKHYKAFKTEDGWNYGRAFDTVIKFQDEKGN